MITFLDENDVEYGALATIKATNAVNGERSLTGTIVSGDYVLSNIERGWRLRFDDEYYVVTYAKPVDEGKNVQVSFDAVHQFFWDFDKSSVYDQLSDGSHTFVAYLEFIFKNSGYSYTVDTALNVYAFEKESFGFKSRLNLFNDVIKQSGVEFQVNGKVVRIMEKVGTDLSTVVRKNFNMNELGIEKNIGDFVTYQKGYGAYFDEEDHSKGRLEVEYTSALASVYGKLEDEPLVDERYTQKDSLLAALKENVDNSYTISVTLDMEDLTRAGYKYTQPVAGDYIMAINETLDFQEKIRIVSFTSEYDVQGGLIKHEVTCNDIGTVKKLTTSYNTAKRQASSASESAARAYNIANKALISADGKNTNYYGNSFPVDSPKGTLKTGDLLFLTVGDTVKQYYWNGSDWLMNPVVNDVEAFKEQIAEELKDVPDREEFEATITEKLATSKAELETQIDTAKTQAESNAKAYADEINQVTAEVAEQANTAANSLKSELAKVKTDLTTVSNTANSAKTSASEAKQQLTTVANDLNTAKQDLQAQASQLQAQASAQSELTKRVSSVEETANGTKTTVSELSKTVDSNTKNITSVTARTKTVEDDLLKTKTILSQVQTTANSASSKTATLETGLNGLSAKFENLSVGNKNYLPTSRVINRGCTNFSYSETSKSWTMTVPASSTGFGNGITFNTSGLNILLNGGETLFFGLMIKASKACSFNYDINNYLSGTTSNDNDDRSKQAWSPSNKSIPANVWTRVWFSYTAKANVPIAEANSNFGIVNNTESITVEIKEVMVAKSNVPVDYQTPDADVEQKIAEYKQTADQNYASLQSNLQTLDGTVKQNKSEFDQTASQIKSSISAVEGKIPTSVGARNYIRSYGLTATGWTSNKAGWKFEIISDSTAKSGQYLKATCTTASTSGGGFYKNLFDFSDGRFFGKQMTWAMDIKLSKAKFIKIGPEWGKAYLNINATTEWQRYSNTFTVATTTEYKQWIVYTNDNVWNVGDVVYIRDVQLEDGSIATSPVPAIEDTELDITKLNTTLTQTANGLEQLSTQVTSQGNTITSHTSSINSLTTGLSAKVSQADFNTLSGRLTTAENNITAKANELSSKISSVEGKIPTSVSTRNLILKSNDLANPHKQSGANTTVTSTDDYFVIKSTGYTANAWGGMSWNMSISAVKAGEEFSILMPVYIDSSIDLDNGWNFNIKNHPSNSTAYNYSIPTNKKDEWFNVAITFKATKDVVFDAYPFYVYLVKNGLVRIKPPMLVRGNLIPSDYQPAPEDYDSKLASAQSEIKQTTDAISASVSALDRSTVKTASLTIGSDGIVMEAGKSPTDIVNAIGTYFGVNPNAINLFSDKINVKANMIVDGAITSTKIASKSINTAHLNGKIITADVIATNAITADAIKAGAITTNKMTANSINGDRITAGTLDAAKIKAGSITASQIASGTITSDQIKAGGISAANIATGAITTAKIAANSINSDKIVSNGLTADVIKGGVLTATNNAMQISLTTGKLEFYTSAAAMRRVLTNYPNQFIKFDTGKYDSIDCGVTVIGSNRNGTSEDTNNGAFAGVRIWNGYNSSKTMDRIDLVGDTIRLVHSAYDSPRGWEFYNWNNNGSPLLKLYGVNADQRAGSYIEAGDIHIMKSDGTYMSLKSILNTFNGNFSSNGGRYYINGI